MKFVNGDMEAGLRTWPGHPVPHAATRNASGLEAELSDLAFSTTLLSLRSR